MHAHVLAEVVSVGSDEWIFFPSDYVCLNLSIIPLSNYDDLFTAAVSLFWRKLVGNLIFMNSQSGIEKEYNYVRSAFGEKELADKNGNQKLSQMNNKFKVEAL